MRFCYSHGFFGVEVPITGYLLVLPALVLNGLMLGSLGLLISSKVKQLENFAGVMNFVVFPLFFVSSALYPLWKMRESSELLYILCSVNPFTHGVELIRFALYGQFSLLSASAVVGALIICLCLALWGFQPSRGQSRRPAG